MKKSVEKDALERFETIWEHVECGITIVDGETREILDVNPVAARMFGDDKSKIIGKRCHKFICPAEEKSCPIMDKGQTVDRSERIFMRCDGQKVPIIKSVAKINYKGRVALLESFTDISNIKEAEEKLRQLSIAEQSSKAKSDFLSRMSHEIRTPMNAIIGMTKIAENTSDIEKLRYCLHNIEISSNHLLGIINDVLDMSKIEAGKFELDEAPFNLEKMLSKIFGIFADMFEQKNIKFTVGLEKNLRINYLGDEMRLSQVITNLLSNAIKFTAPNGTIKLTIKEIKRENTTSTLRFSVLDSGIGMTNEQLKKLFLSFEQADTSISRRFGGTGLGLAISKTIVDKMDGMIWAESEYGIGSRFSFDVKLKYNDKKSDERKIEYANPNELHMLVFESDIESRKYLTDILESFGINVDSVSTREEAVSSTEKKPNHYDAIFIDCENDSKESLDIVREIKIQSKDQIIFMTSFAKWCKIEPKALAAGVSRFLTKPILPSSVLDSINELVSKTVKNKYLNDNQMTYDFSDIHLILAEDVEINRLIFEELFKDVKLNIDIAVNGKEAVELFLKNPDKYDMILMDVQMPEMDGYEATKAIRASSLPNAKSIPIIALTANVFKEDIDKCLNAGMNDHLAKPIDINAVVEKIKRYGKQ